MKKAAFVKKLLKSCTVPLKDQADWTRWDVGAGFLDPHLAFAHLGVE
jgi:hypothetical protein